MRFTFCPLFSGSSGNALFVGAGDTRILIDAGMPGKSIENALREIGVLPETLSGIVVTHEHSDHVKGVGILSRKYHLPVYANERTWNAMAKTVGEISSRDRRFFENEEDFFIGSDGLAIFPFSIPHDAADPVGYRIFLRRQEHRHGHRYRSYAKEDSENPFRRGCAFAGKQS